MAGFVVKKDNTAIESGAPVLVKGDQSSLQKLTIEHKNGTAGAGKKVTLETTAPMYISPVDGVLDANGKLVLTLGPSFGTKGDGSVTVKVKDAGHQSFSYRFTD